MSPNTGYFTCVQLKELAPGDLNPSQTLDDLLRSVRRRAPSDAVLAIHLNRRGTLVLEALAAASVPYSGLWYFWAVDPTHASWRLFGDALGSPDIHEFEYPA